MVLELLSNLQSTMSGIIPVVTQGLVRTTRAAFQGRPLRDEYSGDGAAIGSYEEWLAGETTTAIAGKAKCAETQIRRIVTERRISRLENMATTEQPPSLQCLEFRLL